MAVAGCPDYFLHHPNYQQDTVDRAANHRQADLIGQGFQPSTIQSSPSHQEDDVDLEALVNDMNSSFESLYTSYNMPADSAPLLHNGQTHRVTCHTNAPHQKLQRSQPMHILAVRRLQEEEQQYRTSSLPAIPNPFPELCSPAGSPTLSSGSLPQCQPTDKYIIKIFSEDGMGKMVEIPADMTARDLCQLLVYKNHCVDDNSWALVEHHPALGLGNWLVSFVCYRGVREFIELFHNASVCVCVSATLDAVIIVFVLELKSMMTT